MGKFTFVFVCAAFLCFIKTEGYDYYDEFDVQLELRSVINKLQSLTIEIKRLQRKQKTIEKRLNSVPTDRSDKCCKDIAESIGQSQNIKNNSKDGINENFLRMKKAFSSEKKLLRSKIHLLEQTIEAKGFLQKKSNQKNIDIQDIEEKISRQERITSDLSKKLELFNETLNVKAQFNERRTKAMENNLSTLKTTSDSMNERIDTMSASLASLILSSDKKVSFSVQHKPKTGTVATLYQKNTVIQFKDVIYNDGNGYNETAGIFTAPVSGVYQFIFFVEGLHQGNTFICPDAVVALYVDGKIDAVAFADPRHDKQFASGGNTYINYFTKGQKVLVGTASTCEQNIIVGYRTSFSGHLLY